jgi:hypothetical protein
MWKTTLASGPSALAEPPCVRQLFHQLDSRNKLMSRKQQQCGQTVVDTAAAQTAELSWGSASNASKRHLGAPSAQNESHA